MGNLQSLLCALEQADFILPVLYTTKLSHVMKCSRVPILNFYTVQMFRKVLISTNQNNALFLQQKGIPIKQFESGLFFKRLGQFNGMGTVCNKPAGTADNE